MDNNKNLINEHNNLNLVDIFLLLWRKKFIICLISLIFIILAILNIRFTDYIYEVSIDVKPVQMGAQSPNIDGLRSAILNMGGNQTSANVEFSLYKSLLTSYALSDYLANNTDILKDVFSHEWDQSKSAWIVRKDNTLSKIKKYIKSIIGLPILPPQKPDGERLYKFLSESIKIYSSKKEPLTKIVIETSNPLQGQRILELVHLSADSYLREKKIFRTKMYIDFIIKKLSETRNKDQRSALIQTLSSQQKTMMVAAANMPFAAEPFGSIRTSFYPIRPNFRVHVFLYFLIGFFGSVLFVIVHSSLKLHFKSQNN